MKLFVNAILYAAFAAAPALAQQANDAAPMSVAPSGLTAGQFVQTAVASNTFEIETSRVALEATTDPAVRAFAEHMIQDHEQAAEKLAVAAAAAGVEPPAPFLSTRHKEMLATLTEGDATMIDAAYAEMQVNAHDEAVALFQAYAGRPDPLGAFATETLPTLETHGVEARALTAE